MSFIIDESSKIGQNCDIKDGVIIGKNVIIEDNCYLDYGCIIRDNVIIKRNSYIGVRCILGEYLSDFFNDRENQNHILELGENSIIRSETIIYGDVNIGDNFETGHRVTIREKSIIGNNCRIGTLTDIQGNCKIGNYVRLHSNIFIAPYTVIKDYVWIFANVVITNDPTPPSYGIKGVNIESFASISAGAIILPGVNIGQDSVVGAGSVVTKDVDEMNLVVGNPSRVVCNVKDIKNKFINQNIYPWKYNFSRGMPWDKDGYEMWIKGNRRK